MSRWPIEPMMATSASALPTDDGRWAYEVKWDGVRALAFREGGRLRLQSRSRREITDQYPELEGLGSSAVDPFIIDGEVVALDPTGRPSFERLQSRINLTHARDVARRRAEVPVLYVAFDLVHLDGRDLTALPYLERRRRLDDLAVGGPFVQVPGYHLGEGRSLLEATRQQGLEGLVAKRIDSAYRPGRRTHSWLKIKNFRRQELVVGGWLGGQGGRSGRLGALLVGYHDGAGGLAYAGRVGTGFDDAELARLGDRLAGLHQESCPFSDARGMPPVVRRQARWVRPVMVVEVAFSEWTTAGTLRAPSYKGERHDRDPSEVRREP